MKQQSLSMTKAVVTLQQKRFFFISTSFNSKLFFITFFLFFYVSRFNNFLLQVEFINSIPSVPSRTYLFFCQFYVQFEWSITNFLIFIKRKIFASCLNNQCAYQLMFSTMLFRILKEKLICHDQIIPHAISKTVKLFFIIYFLSCKINMNISICCFLQNVKVNLIYY